MKRHDGLLTNLLSALVDEWGYAKVEAALMRLSILDPKADERDPRRVTRERPHKVRAAKIGASEQVARAQLPTAKEAPLRELAVRFDSKQFLPSVADVREFLIMVGGRPGALKSRSDAFRRILNVLSTMSPERLERLSSSTLHSGPSQLGPLSDAISSAAESLPRYRQS